jgi:hypothetical protein
MRRKTIAELVQELQACLDRLDELESAEKDQETPKSLDGVAKVPHFGSWEMIPATRKTGGLMNSIKSTGDALDG